jgi:hypothetical protein
MLLIWQRNYWKEPIIQEVNSFELRHNYHTKETRFGRRFQDTMWMDITHEDGLRESVRGIEGNEHLILINEEADDFKVIL